MPSKFLRLGFLLVLIICIAVFFSYWIFDHKISLKDKDKIEIGFYEVISVGVGLLQALIYALTLFVISHQLEMAHATNKQNNTIKEVADLLSVKYEFNEYMRIASQLSIDQLINLAKGSNLNSSEKKLRIEIGKFLDRCEHLSVCINSDLYDLNYINKVTGGLLINIYIIFNPYMETVRELSSGKKVYLEFQSVHAKLRVIRSKY